MMLKAWLVAQWRCTGKAVRSLAAFRIFCKIDTVIGYQHAFLWYSARQHALKNPGTWWLVTRSLAMVEDE